MIWRDISPVRQQSDKGGAGEIPCPCFTGICFCVSGARPDPALQALFQRAQHHLAEDGLACRVLASDEPAPPVDPGFLYLADSHETAERMKESGACIAGFLHDGNRSERFPGLRVVFDEPDEVDTDSYRKAWQRLSGLPWTILTTEHLTVRETVVEDVEDFYAIYRDPSMTEYQEGLFADPEDEKRYTADYIRRVYGLLGFGVWTVLLTDEQRIIGRAGFSIRQGFQEIELGFMIGRPWQGHGYAYEVCSAILDYGRDVLLLPRVQALVKEENAASVHLCEKLGFARDGEVEIEEDIYGGSYAPERTVSFSPVHYGRYIRFVREFG